VINSTELLVEESISVASLYLDGSEKPANSSMGLEEGLHPMVLRKDFSKMEYISKKH